MNHSPLLLLLLAGPLLLLPIGCAPPPAAPAPSAPAPAPGPTVYRLSPGTLTRQPIATEVVRMHALRRHVRAPGHAAFPREAMAHVGSPVRGRAAAVRARLGDTVQAGQPLLVVDSSELGTAQSELLLQHSAARTSAPLVELTGRSWQAARALFDESQGIAQSEVLRREHEHRRAEADHAAAVAGAAAARGRLRALGMTDAAIEQLCRSGELQPSLSLPAPRDGLVIACDVVLGDAVGPDRGPLFTLVDPGVLWVLADVPESRLQGLQVGGDAVVHLADGVTTRPGRIGWIAPAIAETTRTAEVRVELAGSGPELLPGAFVDVDLFPAGAAAAPVLAVPDSAVHFLDRRPVVFVPVAGEAGAFTVRSLQLGAKVDGRWPVLLGLHDGDVVVTTGSFLVKSQVLLGSADEGN